MIVMLSPEEGGSNEYLVCPGAPATVVALRERMLRLAKATEGSYAYRLVDDLHVEIFVRSLDLKTDYETYFAREYDSFAEFLTRRMRFPSSAIDALTEAMHDSSGIYYYRPSYSFLSDDYGLEFLARLLEDVETRESSS